MPFQPENPRPSPSPYSAWQSAFEDGYRHLLDRLEQIVSRQPDLAPVAGVFRTYLSGSGKRLRPLVFLAGYRLFAGDRPTLSPEVLQCAAATELLHAFVLAHDDIIDGADSRRGAPSLHRALESLPGFSPLLAQRIAMVLGDILFGFAVEIMAECRCTDPSRLSGLVGQFARIARDTGIGECLELVLTVRDPITVSEASVRQTYYLKTTRYTFVGPLLLGTLLAGAPDDTAALLEPVMRPIGLAFQIENDVHEIAEGDDDATWDLQTGVKTLLLTRALQTASPAQRERCGALFTAAGHDPDARDELRDFLCHSPAITLLRQEVDLLFRQADQAIEFLPFSTEQKTLLLELLDYLHRKRFHSASVRLASG